MTVHVHQDGLLALGFGLAERDRTVIVRRRQRFPLRTTTSTYPDDANPGMPWVIIQNPTGGVFPGDRLAIRLDVGRDARAHVRNQSATKVYSGVGDPAIQDVRISVADGALAEYFGEVLIPHANSAFHQDLSVDLAHTARAICVETIAAGRIAHGERFAFDNVRFTSAFRVDGELVCRDALDLTPTRCDPARRGLFGQTNYMTSIFALCPDDDGEAIAEAVDRRLAAVAGCDAAATVLPNGVGVFVRGLAVTASEARRNARVAWTVLRRQLVGSPLPERMP